MNGIVHKETAIKYPLLKNRSKPNHVVLILALTQYLGEDLQQRVEKNPFTDILFAMSVYLELLLKLKKQESEKVIHTDLKPENVMLHVKADQSCEINIVDLETAFCVDEGKPSGVRLSPLSAPPESGRKWYTFSYDIFQAAALFVRCFNAADFDEKRRKKHSEEHQKTKREQNVGNLFRTRYKLDNLFKGIPISDDHRFRIIQFIKYMLRRDHRDRPTIDETIAFFQRIRREIEAYNPSHITALQEIASDQTKNAEHNRQKIDSLKSNKKELNIFKLYKLTQNVIDDIHAKGEKVNSQAIKDFAKELSGLRISFMDKQQKDEKLLHDFQERFINEVMENKLLNAHPKLKKNLCKQLMEYFSANPGQVHVIEKYNAFDLFLLSQLFKDKSDKKKFKAFKMGSKEERQTYEVEVEDKKFQFQLNTDILKFTTFAGDDVYRVVTEKPTGEKYHTSTIFWSDICLKYDTDGRLVKDVEDPTVIKKMRASDANAEDIDVGALTTQYFFDNGIAFHRLFHLPDSCDDLLQRRRKNRDHPTRDKVYYVAEKVLPGKSNLEQSVKEKLESLKTQHQEGIQRQAAEMQFRIGVIPRFLRGIKKVHDKKVIHVDVKPSNFIDDLENLDDKSKISEPIDFDGALKLKGSETKLEFKLGTRRYAPPEAASDNLKYSLESDIFSTGGMVTEILKADDFFLEKFEAPLKKALEGFFGNMDEVFIKAKEKLPEIKENLSEVKNKLLENFLVESGIRTEIINAAKGSENKTFEEALVELGVDQDKIDRAKYSIDQMNILEIALLESGSVNFYGLLQAKGSFDTSDWDDLIFTAPYHLTHLFSQLPIKPEHRFQIIQFVTYMTQTDPHDRPDVNETIEFFERIQLEMKADAELGVQLPVVPDEDNAGFNKDCIDDLKKHDENVKSFHREFSLYKIYKSTQQFIDALRVDGEKLEASPDKESRDKGRVVLEFVKDLKKIRLDFMNEPEKKSRQDIINFSMKLYNFITEKSESDEELNKHCRPKLDTFLKWLIRIVTFGIAVGYEKYKGHTLFAKTKTREIAEKGIKMLEDALPEFTPPARQG